MEKDMTVGNPTKMILNFTIPLFIGNVFQQLYNMADTIIVGKFVGADALAAVGSTGTIMFLIIGFLQGMAAGFTVPTAQKFGAGDMRAVRKNSRFRGNPVTYCVSDHDCDQHGGNEMALVLYEYAG